MEALLIIGAYLLGGVPFGYLIGKLKGVDLTKHGSGNVGATNTARVLGKEYGILVYFLDFLKGFLPTFLAVKLYGADSWITTLVGLAAVLGHMFSPFMGFKGGKGVATASGVLFAVCPLLALLVLAVWLVVFKTTGYVSAGSLAAALSAVFFAGMLGLPFNLIFLITIVAVLVIVKHRSNLERLLRGEELKV